MQRRSAVARIMAIATLTRPATTSADQEPRGAPEPEEKWLRHLNGRHRQFFDTSTLNNGAPLTRVATRMGWEIAT
jgi:hypothetical protein